MRTKQKFLLFYLFFSDFATIIFGKPSIHPRISPFKIEPQDTSFFDQDKVISLKPETNGLLGKIVVIRGGTDFAIDDDLTTNLDGGKNNHVTPQANEGLGSLFILPQILSGLFVIASLQEISRPVPKGLKKSVNHCVSFLLIFSLAQFMVSAFLASLIVSQLLTRKHVIPEAEGMSALLQYFEYESVTAQVGLLGGILALMSAVVLRSWAVALHENEPQLALSKSLIMAISLFYLLNGKSAGLFLRFWALFFQRHGNQKFLAFVKFAVLAGVVAGLVHCTRNKGLFVEESNAVSASAMQKPEIKNMLLQLAQNFKESLSHNGKTPKPLDDQMQTQTQMTEDEEQSHRKVLDNAIEMDTEASELYENGKFEEALKLYVKSTAAFQTLLGERHLQVSRSLFRIGDILRQTERLDQALEMYTECLSITKEHFGDSHSDIAAIYNNMAIVYKAKKNFTEALRLYEQSIEIRKTVFGKDHESVGDTMYNMAVTYYDMNKVSEAISLFHDAEQVYSAAFGSDHPQTIDAKERAERLTNAQTEAYNNQLNQ